MSMAINYEPCHHSVISILQKLASCPVLLTVRKSLSFSDLSDLSQWKMAMFGNSSAKKKWNTKFNSYRISVEFAENCFPLYESA